ncbi:hypothetical protein GCM10009634_06500 [Saccharothrix xinjiangensis]
MRDPRPVFGGSGPAERIRYPDEADSYDHRPDVKFGKPAPDSPEELKAVDPGDGPAVYPGDECRGEHVFDVPLTDEHSLAFIYAGVAKGEPHRRGSGGRSTSARPPRTWSDSRPPGLRDLPRHPGTRARPRTGPPSPGTPGGGTPSPTRTSPPTPAAPRRA